MTMARSQRVGLLAFALLAGCGAEPASGSDASTADGAVGDGGGGGDSSSKTDACVSPKESCGTPCPGDFVPQPLATASAKNVCTPQQIAALWAGCYANGANAASCDPILAQKTPCLACLLGPASTSPALVEDENRVIRPNVPACLAVASGDPSCGQRAENARACAELFCDTVCGWDYASRAACVSAGRSTYCASWVSNECVPGDAGPTAACAGQDPQSSFVAVATVLCANQGPSDAGAD